MRTEYLPKTGVFILNLDEVSHPGTHWVVVYTMNTTTPLDYLLLNVSKKRIDWYNTRQHQHLNSSLCGLYACYYIICRNRGQTPYEIYENLKKSGNIVKLLQLYSQSETDQRSGNIVTNS